MQWMDSEPACREPTVWNVEVGVLHGVMRPDSTRWRQLDLLQVQDPPMSRIISTVRGDVFRQGSIISRGRAQGTMLIGTCARC